MRIKFDISKPYNILEKVVYEVSALEYDIADETISIIIKNKYCFKACERPVTHELFEKVSDDLLKHGYVDLTESGYNLGFFVHEEQ